MQRHGVPDHIGSRGRCCHIGRGHFGPAPWTEEEMKEIGRKMEEGRESQRGSEIRQWAEPSSEPDGMPRLTTGFFSQIQKAQQTFCEHHPQCPVAADIATIRTSIDKWPFCLQWTALHGTPDCGPHRESQWRWLLIRRMCLRQWYLHCGPRHCSSSSCICCLISTLGDIRECPWHCTKADFMQNEYTVCEAQNPKSKRFYQQLEPATKQNHTVTRSVARGGELEESDTMKPETHKWQPWAHANETFHHTRRKIFGNS